MSHYSQVLQSILERDYEGEQSKLARVSGVAQSILSRHCRDHKQPDPETLLKLCTILPQADATDLIVAHLKDVCPPSMRALIRIEPVTGGQDLLVHDKPGIQDQLDSLDLSTRRAVENLVERSTASPQLRLFLQATARFASGTPA